MDCNGLVCRCRTGIQLQAMREKKIHGTIGSGKMCIMERPCDWEGTRCKSSFQCSKSACLAAYV